MVLMNPRPRFPAGPTGHRCTVFLGVSFAESEEQGRKDLEVLERCPVEPRLVHDVHLSDMYEIWGILDRAFPKLWNMNVDVTCVPHEVTLVRPEHIRTVRSEW
jgi:hypothetical protein